MGPESRRARREARHAPALPGLWIGRAGGRPGRSRPCSCCSHRRVHREPARRLTEPGAPHTRQSRVPGSARPGSGLRSDPAPVGARVTVGQGQSAAGPGQAERRARRPPRPGSLSAPLGGAGRGGARGPKLAGARRGAPPGPGPAPRDAPPFANLPAWGLLRLSVSGPEKSPQARARRGVRASRRASRVRAPRHPASLPLDPRPPTPPRPRPGRQDSPTVASRSRNCLPAGRRGCRRPAPEPAFDRLLWGPTRRPGSHSEHLLAMAFSPPPN